MSERASVDFREKKGFICDMDGVIYHGNKILPGLRISNCHSEDAVMVGDRMDTDVVSGMESGMTTVLVLSGVTTREKMNTYAYRPSIVLNGVGDIPALAAKEQQLP